jgi:fatty acid desaturase
MNYSALPLTADERQALSKTSNALAWRAVVVNWGLIAGTFLLAAWVAHPLSYTAAVLVLAGRSLGLAVLTHDAAHNTLFATRALNQWVGKWLLGALPNVPIDAYRKGHLSHHRHAGTTDDPDLRFVAGYPTSRASLLRKFARDFSGRTGVLDLLRQIKGFTWRAQLPFLVMHAGLVAVLWASGNAPLYGLWWLGQIFVLPALMRLRVMGEHGAMQDHFSKDARLNTRTTHANWIERLLFAPNHVHWHLEHHLLPAVPAYRLRAAHLLLSSRGYYAGHDCIASSYADVVRRCIGISSETLSAYRMGTHGNHFGNMR